METKSVQLTATAKVDAASLEVRYTASNQTDETILLVNRIQRWNDGGHQVYDDRFYTVVAGEDLRLTAAYLDVPDHVDVETPDMPLVTRVGPGATYTGVLRATLPLEPYHPYPGVVRYEEESRTYKNVLVVIGWIPERAGRVTEKDDGEGGKYLYVDHSVAARDQRLAIAPLGATFPTHIKPAR